MLTEVSERPDVRLVAPPEQTYTHDQIIRILEWKFGPNTWKLEDYVEAMLLRELEFQQRVVEYFENLVARGTCPDIVFWNTIGTIASIESQRGENPTLFIRPGFYTLTQSLKLICPKTCHGILTTRGYEHANQVMIGLDFFETDLVLTTTPEIREQRIVLSSVSERLDPKKLSELSWGEIQLANLLMVYQKYSEPRRIVVVGTGRIPEFFGGLGVDDLGPAVLT